MESLLEKAFEGTVVVKCVKTNGIYKKYTWVPKKWNQKVNHWSAARLFKSISGAKNAVSCFGNKEQRKEYCDKHYEFYRFTKGELKLVR